MRNERFVQFCKLPISVVTKFAEEIGVHGPQSQSENNLDYASRVWRVALQNGKSYAATGLVMEHAKPISETHPWIIDPGQMQKDFDTLPEPSQCSMQCARRIVEDHIAVWGHIPHPDKLKDEIAFFLDLMALQSVRRA